MNREQMTALVTDAITKALDAMFPHGAGTTTHHRVRRHLEQVGQIAFEAGRSYALGSLLTADEVAEQFRVTPRRIRARARLLHQRLGLGYQVPGTNQWLFTPEELDALRPGEPGRPRKTA